MKTKKNLKQKLSLGKQTVSHLTSATAEDMSMAKGGGGPSQNVACDIARITYIYSCNNMEHCPFIRTDVDP